MFYWSRFPFVRITVLFMAGIILSVFVPGYQLIFEIAWVVLLALVIVFYFLKRRLFLRYNWLFGFLIVALSFLLGYLRLFAAREDSENSHLIYQEQVIAYKAVVITQPAEKGDFYQATIALVNAKNEEWSPAKGKVNLYVRAEKPPFAYGDELLVQGTPQLVSGPKNPEEFNYKRYLSFLNVFHQHFADSSSVVVLSSNHGNSLIASSLKLREHFSALLKQYVHGNKELAIANALLLGNKDELDDEIKNTYAASGAMHVLAVSGLHVGIIYVIILFILKLVLREHKKEWMVAVVAIPLLWGYAFITGLSPSVLRAVTLFSILALGRAIGRSGKMVNMLAVSAFILLVFNPFLLMQVGFQLSYVAVLGIILIYPQVRKLLMPSQWFWIAIWDITAISIVAQIATFPLSVLYFHRFAPYFLVSNLMVIPAATFMVWLGVLLFTFSWIPALASGLGFVLEWIIRIVNYVLGIIYHLPGSNWDSLYLDIAQTWLWYFIIAGLLLFVVLQKKTWAFATSLCVILLSISVGIRLVKNNKTKQLVVYAIPYHSAVDFIQSGEVVTLQDSSLMNMKDKIHFHIKPQRLLKGATQVSPKKLPWKQLPYGKLVVWNGVSVLIQEDNELDDCIPVDSVVNSREKRETAIVINVGI